MKDILHGFLEWVNLISVELVVSKQPHLGVLFKSQNNTTWTPYDYEDLKFTIYRASFDTTKTGSLTLTNDVVPTKTLGADPIRTFNGSNYCSSRTSKSSYVFFI